MLPVRVVVALTLLREALRAAAMPVHAALYLLRRRAAQRRTRDILTHWTTVDASTALADFLARCPPRARATPHVFVSAGEASGEAHAARLLAAVRAGLPAGARCTAFGGPQLAAAGAQVIVPLSAHAVMGVAGVLKTLPLILATFARFVRLLRHDRPDVVVLVDYPGLHLVLAKAARRAGVPVIHYIAPQYWAWAPWRIARYRGCVDACLAILPFEPAYFRHCGVPCEYVGHPLLDRDASELPARRTVAALRADRWLCLLPGSRRSEIERHLPGMLAVARRLLTKDPQARVTIAHRDPRREPAIREVLARHRADFVEFQLGDVAAKLAAAHVVLAKSGTGSLEAALAGAPNVVVYRVSSRFTMFVYRNYLTAPWFAAANLIAARAVVPEHCFADAAGFAAVGDDVERLWDAGETRLRCLDQLADVQHRLGAPGASARAAHWVLAALGVAPVAAS
jgi:lipid-A-disaccharide synthase